MSYFRALMAAECEAHYISVQPSTIKQPKAGLGLFAWNNFGRDTVIGFYDGSLVYSNLNGRPQQHRMYGEGAMIVTVDDFQKRAIQLYRPCQPMKGTARKIWVVTAKFCAARFINDPRYLPGDKERTSSRTDTPRKAHAIFHMSCQPLSLLQFEQDALIAITATSNIKRGDELFVSYGPEYDIRFGSST